VNKIKMLLLQEYRKTLHDSRKGKEQSVSHVAGKMLVIFIIGIFVFTLVSRAAASVTIAQVITTKAQSGKLTYVIDGEGIITSVDEKYANLLQGFHIDKLYVLSGGKVIKGDKLVKYRVEDLQNKYDSLKLDIEKQKLLIQQANIDTNTGSGSSARTYELSLSQARDNLERAEKNLKETQEDYKKNSEKTKEQLLKDKKEEYTKTQKNYETTKKTQEKELLQSDRAVYDANVALKNINSKVENYNMVIEAYKATLLSKNYIDIYNARERIYETSHGGADSYREYKSEIAKAELSIARAQEDYNEKEEEKKTVLARYHSTQDQSASALETAKNSSDTSVNNAANIKLLTTQYEAAFSNYQDMQSQYVTAVKSLKRSLEDAKNILSNLKSKDNKLEGLIASYCLAVYGTGNIVAAGEELYNFLLGDQKKTIENEVSAANLNLARAEEDYAAVQTSQESTLNDIQEQMTELAQEINSMEQGTYDYEEALEMKKQTIVSGMEAVRIAKQIVDTNELQYKLSIESDAAKQKANIIDAQNVEITIQEYQLQLKTLKKDFKKVSTLLDNKGILKSPCDGTITSIGIEAGQVVSGEKIIKIGSGDFMFRASFDKECSKYVKEGEEIMLTFPGNDRYHSAEIKEVTINSEGEAELTAMLPEGDYLLGEKASFRVTSESDYYNFTIPIEAIRRDTGGDYVYITVEKEGVLGIELEAYPVHVQIIDKDNTLAAIEGISKEEDIITGSTKFIYAGSKVRLQN